MNSEKKTNKVIALNDSNHCCLAGSCIYHEREDELCKFSVDDACQNYLSYFFGAINNVGLNLNPDITKSDQKSISM